MILSVVLGAVGTGLFITIGVEMITAVWAAYLVFIGIGVDIGIQLPYIVLQVALR